MIRALIGGKLFRAPERRTSQSGKPFATAKMTTKQEDGEAVFVSLICFDTELVERLAGIQEGAALAVVGRVTMTTYQAKDGSTKAGMDMVVEELAALAKKPRKPRARRGTQQPGAGDVDWMGA
jgi:single-stranded DNA-binding protein